MNQVPAVRSIEGVEAPAVGAWELDRSHSTVGFSVRHLMVAKVRGRFSGFAGTIQVGERPEDSSVDVTIDAASVDTSDSKRDDHLRSADFLDVEHHPTLRFVSTSVRKTGRESLQMVGDLTIRGATRPVTLEVDYVGVVTDPWGNTKAGFSATTQINREDFGLTWNQALEAGGVLVGKEIKIELEVEAQRK